jgi:flagellar protein FlaF
MAAASLVATAFGVIIILITAYILAAGIIGLAISVAEAQKEMNVMTIKASGTSINITGYSGYDPLSLEIRNTGSEQIDYSHIDVFLKDGDKIPDYYKRDLSGATGWQLITITPDSVYPSAWDPGETLAISVNTGGKNYTWVKVTTPVGVSTSRYLRE